MPKNSGSGANGRSRVPSGAGARQGEVSEETDAGMSRRGGRELQLTDAGQRKRKTRPKLSVRADRPRPRRLSAKGKERDIYQDEEILRPPSPGPSSAPDGILQKGNTKNLNKRISFYSQVRISGGIHTHRDGGLMASEGPAWVRGARERVGGEVSGGDEGGKETGERVRSRDEMRYEATDRHLDDATPPVSVEAPPGIDSSLLEAASSSIAEASSRGSSAGIPLAGKTATPTVSLATATPSLVTTALPTPPTSKTNLPSLPNLPVLSENIGSSVASGASSPVYSTSPSSAYTTQNHSEISLRSADDPGRHRMNSRAAPQSRSSSRNPAELLSTSTGSAGSRASSFCSSIYAPLQPPSKTSPSPRNLRWPLRRNSSLSTLSRGVDAQGNEIVSRADRSGGGERERERCGDREGPWSSSGAGVSSNSGRKRGSSSRGLQDGAPDDTRSRANPNTTVSNIVNTAQVPAEPTEFTAYHSLVDAQRRRHDAINSEKLRQRFENNTSASIWDAMSHMWRTGSIFDLYTDDPLADSSSDEEPTDRTRLLPVPSFSPHGSIYGTVLPSGTMAGGMRKGSGSGAAAISRSRSSSDLRTQKSVARENNAGMRQQNQSQPTSAMSIHGDQNGDSEAPKVGKKSFMSILCCNACR